MLELYYWPTPNNHKVTLFLEEAKLEYRLHPVNIGKGEQFKPEFLKISPNNRVPALVDPTGDHGKPLSIFESGAILQYLGDQTKKFFPTDVATRARVNQWLFWQMGGLGPMTGQLAHFVKYAPEKVPYAVDRYRKETERLLGVIDKQLQLGEYLAGDYSIADMACYPWIVIQSDLGNDLKPFANLERWRERIAARPATVAAYARAKEIV